MARRLIVVCNALDDLTRLDRGISTDSPAASRKVFLMCQAIRLAGVRPTVLSLGRGRQDGSGRFFGAAVRRVGGAPVVYAAFWHRALLSQAVSLIAPAVLLWRMRRRPGATTVVFYNPLPAYLPALLLASLLRLRTVLDLEDGAVSTRAPSLGGAAARLTRALFERLCTGGALLACSELAKTTRLHPAMCYYGTIETRDPARRWPVSGLAVLMGGTVSRETGAHVLVEAIEMIRDQTPAWAEGLTLHITGKGDCIEPLERLAGRPGWPRVVVHGRTTDAEYREIAAVSQVGLALKPGSGLLAHTTFPSKVVELAGAGVLMLTTDISDVRAVLNIGARYLEDESATELAAQLRWIVLNRDAAEAVARAGAERVRERFDPALAGRALAGFLFGADR